MLVAPRGVSCQALEERQRVLLGREGLGGLVRIIMIGETVAFTCVLRGGAQKRPR